MNSTNNQPLLDLPKDRAYFASPIGMVICRFNSEGRLVSCFPLEDNDYPIYSEWIDQSLELHPSLARSIWDCTPPPREYRALMPIADWAPRFWDVLAEVPFGTTLSYGELALKNGLGKNISRAVGRLLGTNPIFILYPCHRIIQADGGFASFRWGVERKIALIKYEASILAKRNKK